MPSILIIAGENSGEKYGTELVKHYKKQHPNTNFFGIGGQGMADAGVELLYYTKDLSVMGIIEVISHIPRIKKIYSNIKTAAITRKPLAAVLIDSPDFNLRLAKQLKKLSIPVLYYISPTVWAWRRNRLKIIKKYVNKMMLIFPFEEKIYQDHGIPAVYVGHPLIERVKTILSKTEFFHLYNISSKKQCISILPGSRKSEIKYHMPVILKTMKKIKAEYNVHFFLIEADNLEKNTYNQFELENMDDLTIITQHGYEAMAYSKLVLSSCGTANLESALLGTPVISFYRISPITYRLGSKLVKINNFSIVNILHGKKLIPELIQNEFTPDRLYAETAKLMDQKSTRKEMTDQFQKIHEFLGNKSASKNVSEELYKVIKTKNSEVIK